MTSLIMRLKTLFLFFLIGSTPLLAQKQQIINIHNRNTTSLNGFWEFLIDPYDNGLLNYRLKPFDEMENEPYPGAPD